MRIVLAFFGNSYASSCLSAPPFCFENLNPNDTTGSSSFKARISPLPPNQSSQMNWEAEIRKAANQRSAEIGGSHGN
jgi:hypothetical protein